MKYQFRSREFQTGLACLRTTNTIESTFATVKLRTRTIKGAGNRDIAETMALKLLQDAEKKWRELQGYKKIPGRLRGEVYKGGQIVEGKVSEDGSLTFPSTPF